VFDSYTVSKGFLIELIRRGKELHWPAFYDHSV
jgi:hypothetical protein